jgi:hypothetical protein
MKKIETGKDVAFLLMMRTRLTNARCEMNECETGAMRLQDEEGLEEIHNLMEQLDKLRTKYRNAMPDNHIEGVEEAIKELGI